MRRRLLSALLGILIAFLAGFLILWAQGYDPFASYASLFSYSLLSQFAVFSTLNKATPLILTGLSAAVGFGSGTINLGQPGQFLLGAMGVTVVGLYLELPPLLMIPLLIIVASAAGALYAGIAAFLRRRFDMNEFITTLMFNFIADYFTVFLISGPLLDRTMYSPMTRPISTGGWLPVVDGLSSAFFVSALAFGLVCFLWNRGRLGYEWRVMGQNPVFSRIGGCPNDANFTRAMLVSGALAGLAGGLMVMGGLQHRFVKGIGANYAWDGVMIAIIANNGIAATGLYALFFAMLQTGAMGMEMETSVPSEFVLVLQAITVLFVVASRESTQLLINQMAAYVKARKTKEAAAEVAAGAAVGAAGAAGAAGTGVAGPSRGEDRAPVDRNA